MLQSVSSQCLTKLSLARMLNFLTVSQTSPGFLHACDSSLLKTLLEKEKMLEIILFPFPTVFSKLSKREIIVLATLNLLSAKSLQFGPGLNFVVW